MTDTLPEGHTPVTQLATQVERRVVVERRAGWHTPDTCDKVIGVQTQVEGLRQQLNANHAKMLCIETKLDTNNKATEELLEIITMGKGFFKTVFAIGKWTRRLVLWVAPVVGAVLSIYHMVTGKPNG